MNVRGPHLLVIAAVLIGLDLAAGTQAWAAQFGYLGVGGLTGSTGGTIYRLRACRYECTQTGSINRIRAYLGGNGQARAALYSENPSNQPDSLIVQSTIIMVNGQGWYTFDVSPTAVTPAWYWIVVQGGPDVIFYYRVDATSPVRYWYHDETAIVDFTSHTPFPTDGSDQREFSFYATEVLLSPTSTTTPTTPTSTPTLTPTSTVTRTSTRTPTATQTGTVTPILSPTPTLTVSQTPPGTYTATPTITRTPTRSATWTVTGTRTLTSTRTLTRTRTPVVTVTPILSPTPRPTVTVTPRPSFTPVPGSVPVEPGQVIAFPNPAPGGRITFAFQTDEAGSAEFKIYDSAYSLVTTFSRPVSPGTVTEAWSGEGLAPGVYLCRVVLTLPYGRRSLPVAKFVVVK